MVDINVNLNISGELLVKGLNEAAPPKEEDVVIPKPVDEVLTKKAHYALGSQFPHGVGGRKRAHRTETAAYTVTKADEIIGVDTTSAAVTITLPTPVAADAGIPWAVIDEGGNAATNNITVATEDSSTIVGAATDVIDVDYGGAGYYHDGTNYFWL